MLEDKALYFALLSELSDPWEAVIDRRLARSIATTLAPMAASGDLVTMFTTFNKALGVNCWYMAICAQPPKRSNWEAAKVFVQKTRHIG